MRKNDIIKNELLAYYKTRPERFKDIKILNITYFLLKNGIAKIKSNKDFTNIENIQHTIFILYDNLKINGEFITCDNYNNFDYFFKNNNISTRTLNELKRDKIMLLINHAHRYNTAKEIRYFTFKKNYNEFEKERLI